MKKVLNQGFDLLDIYGKFKERNFCYRKKSLMCIIITFFVLKKLENI